VIPDLQARVDKLSWWHTIDLGDGVVTPGATFDWFQEALVNGYPPLEGRSVLDVGAWDGYYSFAAERKGAARVLATDSLVWQERTGDYGWNHWEWDHRARPSKAGFLLAREALESKVEDRLVDAMDISAESVGVFDVTLYFGMLYHMRHPLLALEKVAAVTREAVVVESHYDLGNLEYPALRFYPGKEQDGDPTNWVGPNPLCIGAMLREVGFAFVEELWRRPGIGPTGRVLMRAWK